MTGVKLHWISVRERWLIRNGEAARRERVSRSIFLVSARLDSARLGYTRLGSARLGIEMPAAPFDPTRAHEGGSCSVGKKPW